MAFPVVDSFWGSAEPEPGPGLEGDRRADVVVVGAGVSGLSTAYFLKRADPGLDVVLVEQQYAGYGASGRNFGNVPQLARSAIRELVASLGPDDTRVLLDHQALMLDEYEAWLREEGIECEFERVECLLLAHSEAAYDDLRELAHALTQFEFPCELLGPEEVRRQVRLPNQGGLSTGRNGYQQPFKLCRGFRAAVIRRGVRLYEGTRVTGFHSGPRSVEVTLESGRVTAEKAVFATNAFTRLLPGLADGVWPSYTYVIATEPLSPDALAAIGWNPRHRLILDHEPSETYFYMQMRSDGRLLFGGAGVPPAPGPIPEHDNQAAYGRLRAEMLRRFPFLAQAQIDAAWGGPLGFTDSGMPVMAEAAPGVYVNAGYNGRGALMGALSGRVMTGMILGREHEDAGYRRYADLLQRARAPRH